MIRFALKDDFIKLGQVLKAAHLCDTGVEAKYAIQDGLVTVNGQVDTRRGRKIVEGDRIEFNGETVEIVR